MRLRQGLAVIVGPAGTALARLCSGRHCLLTDPRQFDILQSGPGWRGTECNSTN
jgi:hypothetical protein